MNTPQDRTIQVGSICARYWAGGSHGSPVVLVHALGGYVESWLPCFDALASQHRVYAVDLPGHGRTDKPLDASYDIAHLAQFVKDFMAALGIEHAHMAGHSLGGAVVTSMALRHPAAVDRLVLESSGGLGRELGPVLRLVSLPVIGEMMSRPSRSGSAYFFQQIVYDPARVPPELVEHDYELSRQPNTQQCFLKTLRANASLFGQRSSGYRSHVNALPSIQKPVLIVWGREDKVIPVAHGQDAARRLPDAQLHIFDRCGHFPMLEYPEAFTELVLDFLAN